MNIIVSYNKLLDLKGFRLHPGAVPILNESPGSSNYPQAGNKIRMLPKRTGPIKWGNTKVPGCEALASVCLYGEMRECHLANVTAVFMSATSTTAPEMDRG